MKGLLVQSSYTADLIQFLSVLTGQDFYVREHREVFAEWHPRLSAGALAEAAALVGWRPGAPPAAGESV